MNNVDEELQKALKCYQAGQLEKAEHVCRQILQENPSHADSLHLLGGLAIQAGEHDTACELINKAIVNNPRNPVFHSTLGIVLNALGKNIDASQAFEKALRIKPDYAEAWNNLGITKAALGESEDAIGSYQKAMELKPDYSEAYANLGNALIGIGQFDAAVKKYQQALRLKPDMVEVLYNLGKVHKDQNKLEAAVRYFQQAIQLKSDYAEAWNGLGSAMKEQGWIDTAVKHFEKALNLKPDYAEAWNNLGAALANKGQFDGAGEKYMKALKIKPDFEIAWKNLGYTFERLGKFESAVDSYRQALRCKPDYAEAYRSIAFVKKYTEYNDDIKEMECLLKKPGITDEQRIHLSFGLGKAFEDLKEYDKAFEHLAKGNIIKRNTFQYNINDDECLFNKLINIFNKKFFEDRAGYGDLKNTPIFIVGMPRSGTTLVEQILSSHQQVYGADEIRDLEQVLFANNQKLTHNSFPDRVIGLDQEDIAMFAAEYIKRIGIHNIHNKDYVTNKMPSNFLFIGMVRVLFPNAKIIHCKRGSVDTCLSCYKNYFTESLKYVYDLTELGQYYRLYQKLMRHWDDVLPGYVCDVQYEKLVNDQKTQTERLFHYCGLPWDEACLSFHKSDRAVRTASTVQVRQPIYKSSIQLWKRYEQHLQLLLKALEGD